MEMVLVKTVLSLAAVLGLMIGVLYLVRRYVQGGRSSSSLVEIEVLGQRAIGPRRSVQVLKVMDRVLVVGMSEQGMQPLGELSGPDVLAGLEARRRARQEPTAGSATALPGRVVQTFGSHLRAALGVRPRAIAETEDAGA